MVSAFKYPYPKVGVILYIVLIFSAVLLLISSLLIEFTKTFIIWLVGWGIFFIIFPFYVKKFWLKGVNMAFSSEKVTLSTDKGELNEINFADLARITVLTHSRNYICYPEVPYTNRTLSLELKNGSEITLIPNLPQDATENYLENSLNNSGIRFSKHTLIHDTFIGKNRSTAYTIKS